MEVPQEGSPDPSLGELNAKREALLQSNQAHLTSIAEMGAEIDASFMNRLRIDTLVEFIFTRLNTSPEARLMLEAMFEVDFQERVAGTLKSVRAEVRKASFGLGASVSPAQMREMWRREQGKGGDSGMPPGFGG